MCAIIAEDIEVLRSQLCGNIVLSGDDDYDAVRKIWNPIHAKHPAIIARCLSVSDVISSIQFARRHHMPFTVRGGGHNTIQDNSLLIDLSLMRAIKVNALRRRVQIQGGMILRDISQNTTVFGLAVPASHTGVAGLTLGSGFNWLRRKCPLSIKHLVNVEFVSAQGDLIKAKQFHYIKDGNSDGIIMSLEFEVYPIPSEIILASTLYPAEPSNDICPVWLKT